MKKVLTFVFYSNLVKLCLYMNVKVRIEIRHGDLLGKCEYSKRNSLNASCFNANSGSADVTHTLVFLLQLSLAESKHMSVFALSFDNQGDF